MKKIYFISSLFLFIGINAQVGINTDAPQANLHVNGSLQITKELKLGGNATTEGSPGIPNSFVMSGGNNQPVTWATPVSLNIPTVVAIGKVTNSVSATANNSPNFIFNDQTFINNDIVTYNTSTNVYTINKSGYYLINSNVFTSVTTTQTDGTLLLYLIKNNGTIASVMSAYPTTAPSVIKESLADIVKLAAGDRITIRASYTRNVQYSGAGITITYLYQ